MKGIKMILGALAAASLLISVTANAQENTKRGPYETNKAFDNTFIGVGAGINATFLHPTQPSTWGNGSGRRRKLRQMVDSVHRWPSGLARHVEQQQAGL